MRQYVHESQNKFKEVNNMQQEWENKMIRNM
jgi:hypothetical protein